MLREPTKHPESKAAREARFRVQAPNAAPRDILIIPLDTTVDGLVAEMAKQPWKNARFVPFSAGGEAWRAALMEHPADVVVVIGRAGENLSQAISVGEACIDRQIKTSGVLLRNEDVSPEQMSAALRSLRPWTRTLTVITVPDDLPELLHAIGA